MLLFCLHFLWGIALGKFQLIAFSLIQAVLTLVYMIFCECTLKPQKAVKWDDITIIEDQEESTDELVFTETVSPSESLMGKTVSIDMPRPRTASNARRRICKQFSNRK